MRYCLFFCLLLLACSTTYAQTVLTQWNFNGTSATTVPGGTSSPTPSTGSGTMQLIGGVTATFGSGTSSTDPITTSPPNYSLQTATYPAAFTADKTAGIIFSASTVGYNTVSLVFDQRLSNTAANTWIVYYTTDVTASTPVWVQQSVLTFTPDATMTGDRWYNQRTIDFSAVTGLNDNANAGFKIVASFDPVQLNYLAARSTSTYATTGNARFDMVTIQGIALVIVANTVPTVPTISFSGRLNASDTLTATYSYADAENDLEGASIYKWYRADDSSGTNVLEISGANAKTYVLSTDDISKFISFEVTPVAQTGLSPGAPVRANFQGPVQQSLDVLLYPSPFALASGNYSLQTWPASSAPATYPANMTFQTFTTEPSSKTTTPTGLWECTYNGTSRSRMLGLDGNGIGFINTSDIQDTPALCNNGTNQGAYVGAAVVAINTTGVANLTLSWTATLKVAGSGVPAREYHLAPQYKVAGAAGWTDFGSDKEFSSAGATVDQITSYSVDLPAALENQNAVYIRWIYYQIATGNSGSRPEIALDEIAIKIPNAVNAGPTVSGLAEKGLFIVGQPLSASYIYADAEGDVQGTSTVKWFRASDASGTGATEITGATSFNYVTTSADVNDYITFEVTPVAKTGTSPGTPVRSGYNGPILDMGDPSVIKINEVYSRGADTSKVADLKTDWIEFYNPGTKSVTLAGLQICDDGACEILPVNASAQLTIAAGGFLALSQNAENSFTFGLSSLGEYAVLKRPDNETTLDSLNFPALDPSDSYGRFMDGAPSTTRLTPPTKGKSNNTAFPRDITGLSEADEIITQVYPNPVPTNGEVTILASTSNPVKAVMILNSMGQEIQHYDFSSGITSSFASLKSGFYLLKIIHQSGVVEVKKIIKE